MDIVTALIVFVVALFALILASNYFLKSAERIGLMFGISPFVVGVCIIAFGTSLPEATVAIFSVVQGVTEVPVAQTVGSNIANILFVLGVVAIVAKRLDTSKNLIDIDLPLIASITLLFILIIIDGTVHLYEGIFLLGGFICYLTYVFVTEKKKPDSPNQEKKERDVPALIKDFGIIVVTAAVIAVSAHFTINATQSIALSLSIPDGLVAATALALGTSLPELVVSIQAVLRKQADIILGNIFGSNIFNILFVIGIPALFANLNVGEVVLRIGIPALIGATVVFIVSSLSHRLHIWEGLFFVLLYMLIISKMFSVA